MMPANARKLVHLREAGQHPPAVVVVFSREYLAERANAIAARLGAPTPIQAKPADVAGGALEFWPLRGLRAEVYNGDGPRASPGTFAQLVAAVAREAAPVAVYFERGGHWGTDASEFLYCLRYTPHAPTGWPAGWSDALDEDYHARAARKVEAEALADG
ncbi:MAG: hypothetical protein AB7Q01_16450 [Gammaproteobacteria bacterium]